MKRKKLMANCTAWNSASVGEDIAMQARPRVDGGASAFEGPQSTGSRMSGTSFFVELTRVEIGHIRISSAG